MGLVAKQIGALRLLRTEDAIVSPVVLLAERGAQIGRAEFASYLCVVPE